MKKIFFLLCIIILFSCGNKNKNQWQQNVPEVLQENKEKSIISISKRGPDDLVDELYKERLKTSASLAEIEKSFSGLNENRLDSLEDFHNYNSQNKNYYNSASKHLNSITDSLLKKEIDEILINSINKYNIKTGRLTSLEKVLDHTSTSSADQYTILKILVTLKIMESYQQNNLPSSKPIETLIDDYNDLNMKLDSTISKNK